MVYCTRCGTENPDNAKHCTNCGRSLESSLEARFERGAEEWGEQFGRRMEEWGDQFGKRVEEECFGLPHGGSIVGIIFGLIIILVGASWLFGINIEFWPLIIIIFGVLIVTSALYGFTRKK